MHFILHLPHCPFQNILVPLPLPHCSCPIALAPMPLHHYPCPTALAPLPLPHSPCPTALSPLPFSKCPCPSAHAPLLLPHCPFPITLSAIYSPLPKLKGRGGHRPIAPLISAPCILLGLSLIINTTKEKPKTHQLIIHTNTVQDILINSFMTHIIFYIIFASGLHSNFRSRQLDKGHFGPLLAPLICLAPLWPP